MKEGGGRTISKKEVVVGGGVSPGLKNQSGRSCEPKRRGGEEYSGETTQ